MNRSTHRRLENETASNNGTEIDSNYDPDVDSARAHASVGDDTKDIAGNTASGGDDK